MRDSTNQVGGPTQRVGGGVLLLLILALTPSCQQRPDPASVDAVAPERHGRHLVSWMEDLRSADATTHAAALRVMASFGTEAVGPLQDWLGASDPSQVLGATQALAGLGAFAGPAVPQLRANLGHTDPRIRAESARALGSAGPRAAAAIPELVIATGDADWLTRFQAVTSLGALRATSGDPGERLTCLAHHDRDERLRAAAQRSLAGVPARNELGCPAPGSAER